MKKMSKKMKKILGMILVVIGIMMLVNSTAYAVGNEEEAKDIISVLIDEGFIYDEYEEVWMYISYDFYGEGEYCYVHAWFDVENNIGAAASFEYNKFGLVESCECVAIRWNYSIGDVETLGEFEWEQ